MKILATVELEFSTMPEDAAKELARETLEARGLNVSRVALAKAPAEGKEWAPKAKAPGALMMADGRGYVVWSDGPRPGTKWAMPAIPQDGDAPVYLLTPSNRGYVTAAPYHLNGQYHGGTNCSGCKAVA